jgi:hypothetical protein
MRPEKCTACGGYCCEDHARRWRPSLRYVHGWPYEHTCPDCPDGYAPAPDAPADDWAAVVAWLREQSGGLEGDALLEWMSARMKSNEEQRNNNLE